MAISCAYCGAEHASPAEVKQCWQTNGEQEPELPLSQPIAPASRVVGAGAGPDELGRHCIVSPNTTAPNPWGDADRVVIDAAGLESPGPLLDRLRDAHHRRTRLTIELAIEFERPPMLMTEAPPFEVGPRFAFDLDELHHLVWSNSIDVRGADGHTWSLLSDAVAAGASAVSDGIGDIELADGSRRWIDGGPFRHHDPVGGVDVVHAIAIEHGSFVAPSANVARDDLAEDQLAAVTHGGGAARIIAPAGSGKTRVLTARARHLITRWHVPPSAICLVAFNKRAQQEMTERTTDLSGLQVRTLNALALAIIDGRAPFAPQARRWNTIDEPDVRRIIGDLVSFPKRRNSDPIAPWIEALSLIRLGLVDPADAESRYDGEVDGLSAMWPAYRATLEKRGAVDFDDQIYRALAVLLTDPAARRAAQRACRVMLVDEFQDLTPAHLLLIRLLSSPGGWVFGVGDDDQTIYGYNGADPAWLIDFAGLFPGAGMHPLEVNYRCPAGVVDVVDRLLRHNHRRVDKAIRAASTDPSGWSVDTSVDPVAASCAAVQAAIDAGATAADVAVLTRVNAMLAPVQVALVTAGVPVSGGVGLEFMDRTSVRAMLSWLRLANAGPSSSTRFAPDDIREALRRPSRSVHPRISDWVAEQTNIVDLFRLAARLTNERDSATVTEFAGDIQRLQKLIAGGSVTSDIAHTLIDEIGLGGAVASLDVTRHGMNRGAQGDDLTALLHLAAQHDDPATFESWLRSQLTVRRSGDGVTLATVHRVKGQEWPHVVVHFADANQYPHRLAEDVEEERRLFHVALTRASTHVTIVTGPVPSPFLAELTEEPGERAEVTAHAAAGPAPRSTKPLPADPLADLDGPAAERYNALRDLRNQLRDGKPAYVVFDNKTLAAIARTAPTSRAELGRIGGIGPAKLESYGEAVIDLMCRLTGA